MAYIPNTDAFNSAQIPEIEPTNSISAAFVNWFYQKFLSNDQRLKDMVDIRDRLVYVTLSSSGWVGSSAPYTQTLNVDRDGVALPFTSNDKPTLIPRLSSYATVDQQKAYQKAYGIVGSGIATTGNGTITFKVWKLPVTTITVALKGV